jgi:hypothetical protein
MLGIILKKVHDAAPIGRMLLVSISGLIANFFIQHCDPDISKSLLLKVLFAMRYSEHTNNIKNIWSLSAESSNWKHIKNKYTKTIKQIEKLKWAFLQNQLR